MHVHLRTITDGDLEFLWKLHNATLREYIEKTWGWNEEWQRHEFVSKFNPAVGLIITVDDIDAGFWWVAEGKTEVELLSIRILPEFQNRGIGTQLITSLLSRSEKPVYLRVLKVNPARSLYQRLGFVVYAENETHFQMIKKPTF